MKGDFHVRFCERLAGEIPACLLDRERLWRVCPQKLLCDFASASPARTIVERPAASRRDVTYKSGKHCKIEKTIDG